MNESILSGWSDNLLQASAFRQWAEPSAGLGLAVPIRLNLPLCTVEQASIRATPKVACHSCS